MEPGRIPFLTANWTIAAAITLSLITSASCLANVPPPASVEIKLKGDIAETILQRLATAGLDAHLVCFYGSNNDHEHPGLIANCTNRNHELLFVAAAEGSSPREIWIGFPWACADDQLVANQVVHEFIKTVSARSDVVIKKDTRGSSCKE